MRLKDGRWLAVDKANPADAAEILQFLNIAAGESDNLSSRPGDFSATVPQEASFLAQQAARLNAVHFIGKVDGRVMSIGALSTPYQHRTAHTSELSVIVARAFWRLGAGTALMQALLDYAKACGTLKLLHLGVRAANLRAIALYRRFGFAPCGSYAGYFRIGDEYDDELLMSLRI